MSASDNEEKEEKTSSYQQTIGVGVSIIRAIGSSHPEASGNVWRHFQLSHSRVMLPTSSGCEPGMLLRLTMQATTDKNHLAPNSIVLRLRDPGLGGD